MALVIPSSMLATKTPSFSSSYPSQTHLYSKRTTHIALAKKGLSSRPRRLDKRDRKGGAATSTTTQEEEEVIAASGDGALEVGGGVPYVLPELPGDKPDPFEGPQWDGLGFFLQYQWAFGLVFALIACVIAVSTYNEGATDFKQTPVYKEAIQSRDLLEEPEASNSDVFESNPTEEAPSLE